MRVLYSAPSSKLIVSMDSPWLELSNSILFANFHRHLNFFSFSVCFYQADRINRRDEELAWEEVGSACGAPLAAKEIRRG
jgi:hypothetical protein